eukprot:CAMPEP_0201149624 /NCGR_PEP_ID=MMETSP0851-20130426/10890_1 /ASSEMBLY_ACC=CAM_ASM_000631 /TAXON_ID=183588 /ORGANISM="Pseudo-nitzschia fraudulenta, Strain WWA7" /LENGTH=61 /DNA_ID=CAMNT_0047426059 /DNA_START=1 /DNA_END=186 /DNA_ORIENTATION=-
MDGDCRSSETTQNNSINNDNERFLLLVRLSMSDRNSNSNGSGPFSSNSIISISNATDEFDQ